MSVGRRRVSAYSLEVVRSGRIRVEPSRFFPERAEL